MKHGILFVAVVTALFFLSCTPKKSTDERGILTDSIAIKEGQIAFSQDCSSCHNFAQDGIGPHLGGLTLDVSADWIKSFIKDPKSIVDSGDERAVKMYKKFKAYMPSFAHYPDEKIDEVIAYLNTNKVRPKLKEPDDPNALRDPVPESIPMSDLVVDLELITEIPHSSENKPFTRIAKLDYQPNTDNLFVMDLRGKLYYLNGNQPEVYMDMNVLKPQFINQPGLATGFGSFAFHPEFSKNGLLYTSHTESPGSAKADFAYADSIRVTVQWVVSEWKTDSPGAFPFKGESRELFRVNMVTGIHGMQEIVFNNLAKPGDDDYGLLYIGIGDGGSAENGFLFLCHSTEQIWGTVLRIDPRGKNSSNGNYGIPPNNPFVKSDNKNVQPEIFAYGFRNPHRITWSKKGQMVVSNIGHHMVEALYIVEPGLDYGWPIREGTFLIDPSQNMYNIYPLPEDDAQHKITYPVAQYDHDEGNAIAGGFEYWGKSLPQLKGKFLFGDIVKGRLFYVEMDDLKVGSQAPIKEFQITFKGEKTTLAELCGANKVDERFGRDRQGELYITTKPDGRVYRLAQARIEK